MYWYLSCFLNINTLKNARSISTICKYVLYSGFSVSQTNQYDVILFRNTRNAGLGRMLCRTGVASIVSRLDPNMPSLRPNGGTEQTAVTILTAKLLDS